MQGQLKCISLPVTKRLYNGLQTFSQIFSQVSLEKQDPLGKSPPEDSETAEVLWIALHKSFRKATRENNIAILGTKFPFQFHAHLLPICLPSGTFSDTNAGKLIRYIPSGIILIGKKNPTP